MLLLAASDDIRRRYGRVMRLLFTFAGGEGHLQPLLPLARAAAARGHEVVVSGAQSLRRAAAGLEFVASGPDVVPQRVELRPFDLAAELRVVREAYAGRFARARAADVLGVCGERRPDVVVRDEFDFGAAVAAERLGIASACVLVNASGGFLGAARAGEPYARLRAEHGLPAGSRAELVLCPFPLSFRDPADPLPPAAVSFRAIEPRRAAAGGRPLVYVTLGTIFNTESGDLLARIVRGVRELPVDVVVTVGRTLDPGELGAQPRNVRVERFVPQDELLPRCAAAVSHAGSGSVAGALAHGVPLVCVPIGADQPLNAARCVALGAGLALDPLTLRPEDARDAVAEVLDEPAHRRAAERLRDELAKQSSVGDAVAAMEALG
jgi:UDP:flavonoid glycosyltransferase YjiC (YdhE family)